MNSTRREEHMLRKAKRTLSKIQRIDKMVKARMHLNHTQQEELYTHLVERMDDLDIPVVSTKYTLEYNLLYNDEANGSKMNVDITDREKYLAELLGYLPYVPEGSEIESDIVSELFSTFVPGPLVKPTHNPPSPQDSESMDEVEEIDFPFTAPPPAQQSPEYVASKLAMINGMVEENKNLNKAQKEKLVNLLCSYHDVFSMKGENLKQTDIAVHDIDTGDTPPFRERLRNYSPSTQAIIDKEVKKMIDQGVLVPSKSPYASNLLLVRKPDASSENGMKERVCASFVKLNSLTRKDSYPLPNIQHIFDSIGKSEWYTTMDLLSGFWQVMIKPEHRHKTAVITARGLYEYAVMAFDYATLLLPFND